MASQLASGDLVSDRYASALYDLAAEKKLVDSVLNDLSNLKNILKDNKELSLVVKSPLISSSDKQNIFETLLKKINANELTNTFIKVIERIMSSRVENYDDDKLHDFLSYIQSKIFNLDTRIHKSWFHLHG